MATYLKGHEDCQTVEKTPIDSMQPSHVHVTCHRSSSDGQAKATIQCCCQQDDEVRIEWHLSVDTTTTSMVEPASMTAEHLPLLFAMMRNLRMKLTERGGFWPSARVPCRVRLYLTYMSPPSCSWLSCSSSSSSANLQSTSAITSSPSKDSPQYHCQIAESTDSIL